MPLYTMKEILSDAQQKKYGVGYFNGVNMEMVRAYIRAAEEMRSPIIIGTAEGLLGCASLEWIAPLLIDAARRANVPVAVHLDHAYQFETLMQALRCGFGSVMFDGSRLSYAENVAASAEIARIAHPMGAGVECELGCVGGLENETGNVDDNIYTDPQLAQEFTARTNADFLAVSIGTVHGVYRSTPKLDLARLGEIRSKVEAPLVLHGGSGLSDGDFQNSIAGGICKINIYTDVVLAGRSALTDIGDQTYTDLQKSAEERMYAETVRKIQIFGSENRC